MKFSTHELEQLWQAFGETLYMIVIPLIFIVIIGLFVGMLVYTTSKGGLFENKYVHAVSDFLVNTLRAIPFIILLLLLIPLTKLLTGSILGAKAAIPSLVFAASPFFARICVLAFQEIDSGTIEASQALGASKFDIIFKVLIPESLPAILSGISITAISLAGYTAMAGVIGAGGLGFLAYNYGYVRRNDMILWTATIIIVLIVFSLQFLGDLAVRKFDKR